MKEYFLDASLLAFSLLSVATATPALADGPVQVKLGDASHFYKAPLQIQLINDDPRVSDHRGMPAERIYRFNMPPMPQAATEIVNMGSPAGTTGNSIGSNPITIRSNHLPQADFGSNIPAQSIARNLPQGSSTNGLRNTAIDWSGPRHPIATRAVPQSTKSARQADSGPIGTATYSTPQGAASSSTQSVTTGVIGEVKRYSLLKK